MDEADELLACCDALKHGRSLNVKVVIVIPHVDGIIASHAISHIHLLPEDLRQSIDFGLDLTPVVFTGPVLEGLPHVFAADAILVAVVLRLVGG